ncbi:DUF2264 domain-containing protein [Acuticoccus sp. MNP-M23]|uniref:DUF2264 domain-containing protein n=1 Tax=Acuticoccus sp. MNP-M23 TaxID=3072793 RepID=UPI0028152523|nr:DUF2264 domain-containing protein [Acuticoccus sp. MNP-M23]WMS44566.1 DUF2264 domain-containing protein [Acuticoccus sp. MNP-M23]
MNPIEGNPLESRADFARSVVDLWRPVKSFFSKGRARVSLGLPAAHFTRTAAELEGFSRPLFGLAPLSAGGLPFDDWAMFREGYANGTDPAHPEYWGTFQSRDQRLVESAAIGFGLLFAKKDLWDPLDDTAKGHVADWLKFTLTQRTADNNWHFFHVLASMALSHVGIDHDLSVREEALDRLEQFYVGDGWYSDGVLRRFDHYIGFAMHFYGLIYAGFAADDDARAARFRARAAEFAQEFQHWFDAKGASLAFGRSMTYRFAQASFWAGLAFADVEALPWGEIRGLWARNLRWWGERDYFDRDGIMGIGYAYPSLHMCEVYNSPGSPYWALKAYLPLALPESHPFWSTPEAPKTNADATYASNVAGMVGYGSGAGRVVLSSCNEMRVPLRGNAEKYAKFAYSTALGFSMDSASLGFTINPFDNMLALSPDGRTFLTRSHNEDARIGDDWLYARWEPADGISVETWLLARPPFHIRAHKVTTDKKLFTTEGGFAIERTDREPDEEVADAGRALVVTADHASLAVALGEDGRGESLRRAHPNTSLHFPQTHVPHLFGTLEPGTTWLMGAFVASTTPADAAGWPAAIPAAPTVAALEEMAANGTPVKGMERREGTPPPFPGDTGTPPAAGWRA